MDPSGKLRSQPPAPAEGGEFLFPMHECVSDPGFESFLPDLLKEYQQTFGTDARVGPPSLPEARVQVPLPANVEKHLSFSEMRNLAFELLLHRLAQQQAQNTLRTETSTLLSSFKESEPAPLVLSTLMPVATAKSPDDESDPSRESHDFILPTLTILAVGLAMILGVLLGMHSVRNRTAARVPRQSESLRALSAASTQSNGLSSTADSVQGNVAQLTDGAHHGGSQHTQRKVSAQPQTTGGLTIYKNDKVVFQLAPVQAKPQLETHD